jgi:hypothetical protein
LRKKKKGVLTEWSPAEKSFEKKKRGVLTEWRCDLKIFEKKKKGGFNGIEICEKEKKITHLSHAREAMFNLDTLALMIVLLSLLAVILLFLFVWWLCTRSRPQCSVLMSPDIVNRYIICNEPATSKNSILLSVLSVMDKKKE